MTVKTLIEKLSHYNKDAIVRLHHREGEELLFALAFQNDDTTVVLETENDNDMREEIQARKASTIVNDFFADMNPSLWNGSTSMPKSFDNRAWQYPLTDDVNLEITFVYNEEDGWCHYCDLVYQSDDSSFDMLSGHGIDSILNVTDTVMDLCRDY